MGQSRYQHADRQHVLCNGHLEPGAMVSIEQYMSGCHGRLQHTKGKELKSKQYTGGTLFVDHASGYIFVHNQILLRTGEILQGKRAFEAFAEQHVVTIKNYHADNAPFNSQEFKDDLRLKGQDISFSGVGAHHQNGVAENAIWTVTGWARAMLLHSIFYWLEQADPTLWPFALNNSMMLWNSMPQRESLVAPIEILAVLSLIATSTYSKLVFGEHPHMCLTQPCRTARRCQNGTHGQDVADSLACRQNI